MSIKAPVNPLLGLKALGQSIWLDYISRDILEDGTLARMIEQDGVSGVTSNPAIFEHAIESGVYTEAIADAKRTHPEAAAVYETIAVADIMGAADVLKPVYDSTAGVDGFVSLEVSPALAHDAKATCAEARRLWQRVNRPNLMIKVPATPAGLQAVATLIGEGINVNVTLLFSRTVYRAVAEAYMDGVESLMARGGDVSAVASVASFFVSRIDTAVDRRIDEVLAGASSQDAQALAALEGGVAVASARLAYQDYLSLVKASRWQSLASGGARPQRLLWGSTSTKNPAYRDVLYVEELIGPNTVNTVPMKTLDAFRDHGKPRASLVEETEKARAVLDSLARYEIDLDSITAGLLRDGIELFASANDRLLHALA